MLAIFFARGDGGHLCIGLDLLSLVFDERNQTFLAGLIRYLILLHYDRRSLIRVGLYLASLVIIGVLGVSTIVLLDRALVTLSFNLAHFVSERGSGLMAN